MKPPHGTTIIDVADPAHPKRGGTRSCSRTTLLAHATRCAWSGDLMIVNVEQNNRHLLRTRRAAPGAARRAEGSRRRCPRPRTDAELAVELECRNRSDIPVLREGDASAATTTAAFAIYDISGQGRTAKLHRTTRRRTASACIASTSIARYAYISTEMEGYVGNILVIYDIARSGPAGGSGAVVDAGPARRRPARQPTWRATTTACIMRMREGDQFWASVWHAGMRVHRRRGHHEAAHVVGAYDYHPPFPEPTHTVLRGPRAGRRPSRLRSRSTRSTSTSTASRTRASSGCSTSPISARSSRSRCSSSQRDGDSPWSRTRRASAPTSSRSTWTIRWSFRCGSRAACVSSTSPIRICPGRSATSSRSR